MKFKSLEISDWKQFHNLNIQFHDKLTVLTGANGSGKTTILNMLARHFGWSLNELATPAKDEESGIIRFFSRWFKKKINSNSSLIGKIYYSNNTVANIQIPDSNKAQYQPQINPAYAIRGLNIPSHRPVFYYQQIPNISTKKRTKETAYQLTFQNHMSKYHIGHSQPSKPTNFFIKETLLNWAIGGSGNEFMQADKELYDYYKGFESVLTAILPKTLGFNKISIRNYEIVLETESGDFMLDAVSGGVSAIIDLAWQIFNYVKDENEAVTVLIDEVENHLHANMQRSILPDLISAFPNLQFIISTHSPLIIGSVKDSNVYAFRYNEERKIYNEQLDLINKAKSATEILNEVLGVPFTMPIWVENSLNEITEKYSNQELTKDSFQQMRIELKELGLDNLMPLALEKSIEKNNG
ncbi:AAA family ATPase [Marivirga atlantica]|jgi:predicted ATPase|uniref:AAA family ATPase n=2 Tax=Marivirga atlantica TaxID=1548457 RepID=A0A937AGZ6_9BACT|nr:AAA family ATPase [Marivirga atlantica]